MSLNLENIFVDCSEQEPVAALVEQFLVSRGTPEPDWGLPSSRELLRRLEAKRAVAVSPPRGGWIGVVEAGEAVDFSIASELSRGLATTVVVLQIAEAVGSFGYAVASGGVVVESEFCEVAADPLGCAREVLRRLSVPFEPMLVREVVRREPEGWRVIRNAPWAT